MRVYDSLSEAMGNTPLVRLHSVTQGRANTADELEKLVGQFSLA